MFSTDPKLQYFAYDVGQFDFRSIYKAHFAEAIGCPAPEEFHNHIPAERMPTDPVEGTAHTYGHDILYAIDPKFRQAGIVPAKDRGFLALYREFMRWFEKEVVGEPMVFQRLPSLRIHYPGFTSYGIMHRDSDYNHPTEEINVWVPITKAAGTASMVIESEVGRGDYSPVTLDYGKFLIFDSELMHGNEINREGYTRMSFDVRFIPRRLYADHVGQKSATFGNEFALGAYYDAF